MPDETTKEFVLEFSTNAAEASKDINALGKSLNDLGEKQQGEAEKEKNADAMRTRAASNLRQILEAMLGQLRQMNLALGEVSSSSIRTADTAEKAFKKAITINRALRAEKQRGDREEVKRQIDARENFKDEQSRNSDRLRTLKILAAGGAVLGIGKMAISAASDVTGRGMSFVNAAELTGVSSRYLQGLSYLIKQRGGSEGAAAQSIGALAQTLFGIQRGYANPDAAAAQYLGNAPWRGTPQQFLEYLADRLPQLSPQAAVSATSGLGISPELVALLRSAGGSANWRKMIFGASSSAADLSKNAKDSQEALTKIKNGIDKALGYLKDILAWLNRHLSSEMLENIGTAAAFLTTAIGGKIGFNAVRNLIIPKVPVTTPPVTPPGGNPAPTPTETPKPGGKILSFLTNPYVYLFAQATSGAAAMASSLIMGAMWGKKRMRKVGVLPSLNNDEDQFDLNKTINEIYPEDGVPLSFNFRKIEDNIRNNPFNYTSGRDHFDLTNGGRTADNRQLAVNVENINITTHDDPQSVANAAQDGLSAAALRLYDRYSAGVYVS